MTASQLFYYTTLWSVLIPIIVGIFNRLALNKTLKLVWITIIVNAFLTLTSFMPVKSWFGLNDNNFLFYINATVNIILHYLIFKDLLSLQKQKIILILLVLFLLAIPLLIFIWGYDFKTLSMVVNLESTFSLVLCLMYLTKLNKDYSGESLRREPMFWISIGYLITNSLSILMMTFIDPIYQYSQELFTFIWDIFSPLSNTLKYILFSIGFLRAK